MAQTVTGAPVAQQMEAVSLASVPGVVVRESTQMVDAVMGAIGGAYEKANRYRVFALPKEKKPATVHGDDGWLPKLEELDRLPQLMQLVEESGTCARVCLSAFGGLNLRALKLHFYDVHTNAEVYQMDRKCRCGACCGCPMSLKLFNTNGDMIGKVREEGCCAACWHNCLGINIQKVYVGSSRDSLKHKYNIVNWNCCCGRVSNFCGATCCKPNQFIDITDPQGRMIVPAYKTFGGDGGCAACCRCSYQMNNYVLPFPEGASGDERMLLLAALMGVEYAYHSRKGGENNN